MKSLFKSLSVILALAFSLSSHAKETITILWGFNIGSNQANTVRLLCDELNQSQDKYTFVIGHKPGAGGTIAANAVSASPNNTLVSMSSSFIIRPYYETKEAKHNLDNFSPILVQGLGSPLVFVSSKHNTIEQAMSSSNLSIGVSGIGSISHLAANEFTNINNTTAMVNFKSNIDAAIAAGGNHIDLAVGFVPDVQPLLDAGKVRVIGLTGKNEIYPGKNMLLSKHRMPDSSSLTANFAIFASNEMERNKFEEIHAMLVRANFRPSVVESYKRDYLTVVALNIEQSQLWYANERKYWKKQVEKISKAK